MSAVPVDIYVSDESTSPVPIENAEVGIFDVGTHTLVAGATTDSDGLAAFSLTGVADPGQSYEVRVFKLGVNFHGLHTIAVLDPATTPNKFDISGADSNILPLSSSPYLCKCTGVFVDFTGQPIANKTLRFMAQAENIDKIPVLWNQPSRMVSPDELQITTDGNGRASVDLLRTGQYWATFGGNDDTVWSITVPDQYSVNLIDLFHPFPVLWDWDDTAAPGNVVSLAVGASVEVPIVVTFSDYSQRGTQLEPFFDVINSDGLVVEATYVSDRGILFLEGRVSGSVTITPTLKTGLKPNRWPVPAVTAPGLLVNVT